MTVPRKAKRWKVGDRVEFRFADHPNMKGGDGRRGVLVRPLSRAYGEWWVRLDDGKMVMWAQRHFVPVDAPLDMR